MPDDNAGTNNEGVTADARNEARAASARKYAPESMQFCQAFAEPQMEAYISYVQWYEEG